jgi:anti-anti-sigma factor
MSAVAIERIDGVPVARVSDDIDVANAATVREQLVAALGPDTHSVIVDLGETRFVDSAGLDMLLRLGDRLEHRRAKLMLLIPESSQLNRLAAIVGLPQAIPVHPTLVAAQQAAARLPTSASAPPQADSRQDAAGC